MVVVIADTARNVALEDAGDNLFGVSAGNDVSARDWQSADIQWTRAEGTRTFNAVGPHLVTGLDSQYFTLYPGDLVWTGTMGSTQALEPGDVFEVEVEGVRVLGNEVVAEGR